MGIKSRNVTVLSANVPSNPDSTAFQRNLSMLRSGFNCESITWSLCLIVVIVMIVVEITIYTYHFLQQPVITHVQQNDASYTAVTDREAGLNYPNIIVCPRAPINESKFSRLNNRERTALRALVYPTRFRNYLEDVSTWSDAERNSAENSLRKEITNRNHTLRDYYRYLAYECDSFIDQCLMARDGQYSSFDCCLSSVASRLPTWHGPCLLLAFDEIKDMRAKQAGEADEIVLDLKLQNAGQVRGNGESGYSIFLVDRWFYNPPTQPIKIQEGFDHHLRYKAKYYSIEMIHEKTLRLWRHNDNKRRHSVVPTGRGLVDDKEGSEQTWLGQTTWRRPDCEIICQVKLIHEECGCMPFYIAYSDTGTDTTQECSLNETMYCIDRFVHQYTSTTSTTLAPTTVDYDHNSTAVPDGAPVKPTPSVFQNPLKRDIKEWWLRQLPEFGKCKQNCLSGLDHRTYSAQVTTTRLDDSARARIHIAYTRLVYTSYLQKAEITISDTLWHIGTNISIWVVLYITAYYTVHWMKGCCPSCRRGKKGSVADEVLRAAVRQGQSEDEEAAAVYQNDEGSVNLRKESALIQRRSSIAARRSYANSPAMGRQSKVSPTREGAVIQPITKASVVQGDSNNGIQQMNNNNNNSPQQQGNNSTIQLPPINGVVHATTIEETTTIQQPPIQPIQQSNAQIQLPAIQHPQLQHSQTSGAFSFSGSIIQPLPSAS